MREPYSGCESNEVMIHTLPLGSLFEIDLGTRKRRGILVRCNRGSVTVEVEGAADYQYWCLETQVVPGKMENSKDWLRQLVPQNGAAGTLRSHRQPIVTLYLPTKKNARQFMDKKNKSQKAELYRAIVRAQEKPTFAAIMAAIDRSVLDTQCKSLEQNMRGHMYYLVKDGFVNVAKE